MIVSFCCKSTYNKSYHRKDSPFEHLDSLEASRKAINFSFAEQEEKKWLISGKVEERTGSLFFYKTEKNDSLKRPFDIARIIANSHKVKSNWRKKVTIDDVLDEHVFKMENWSGLKNFEYLLLTSNHKKYGKFYIIKYKNKSWYSKYTRKNVDFLFYYKGYGFIIQYNAVEEYFDKFLPDVEGMVKSFQIKE